MTLRIERMVSEQFHRDVEGRPIREGRTPREFLRDGDIEYKACPYTGSRHQHEKPMNASALRQTGAHWDAILAALARLRHLHDRALGVTEPALMDIWRTSQLASSLPWFYILRDRPVPAYAAALSKAALGMGIWCQRLLVRTIAEGWSPGPLTAERILELAEDSGTLIGDTEVCSGGDKMLLRYFDVHVTAQPTEGAFARSGVAGSRGDAAGRRGDDIDLADGDVLRFGAFYADFKLWLWLYWLARRFLVADLGKHELLAEMFVEPSDFFLVEPTDLAEVSPEQRFGWFRSLADLIVPFAPRGADLDLRDCGFALAEAMGKGTSTAETAARLDGLFTRVIQFVEVGLHEPGSCPAFAISAELRDRLIGTPLRAIVAGS